MGTAKVTLNGVVYDVPEGFATAFASSITAEKLRFDSVDSALTAAKADVVKMGAERDAQKILAERAGKVDIQALVASRVKLERSVAGMRFDEGEGVEEGKLKVADMADRDIMIAAIKTAVKDYSPDGKSDEEVEIYFSALQAAGVLKAAPAPGGEGAPDDGRDALQGTRQDAAPGNSLAAKRKAFAGRNDYRNTGGQ